MRDLVLKDKVDRSCQRTLGVDLWLTQHVFMCINMHIHLYKYTCTHTILKKKNNLAFPSLKRSENNLLIGITDEF